MKSMFFLMAMLCLTAIGANAQYTSLSIQNNTACTVYVELKGTTNASGCMIDHSSTSIIAIPPGITEFSDPTDGVTMSDGGSTLGTTDKFTAVRVIDINPAGASCHTPNFVFMGDCFPGTVTYASMWLYNWTGTSCPICTTVSTPPNIYWQVMSPTYASVIITE